MKSYSNSKFQNIVNCLIEDIKTDGEIVNTRTGTTKELLNVSFELTDPDDYLIESANYEYAEDFLSYLMSAKKYIEDFEGVDFSKKYPHTIKYTQRRGLSEGYSTAYGPKIENQLGEVLEELGRKGSRRAVINIVIPEDQLVLGLPTPMEYPCCISIQAIIRNSKLHLICNYRSNNALKVLPYDLYLMRGLQKLLCSRMESPAGSIIFNIASCHIFLKDLT